MNDQRVLEFVTKLCQRHGATRIVLFGSRARGNCHELSDYDIAIFGINDSKTKLVIREECEESAPTLKKIDVVFTHEASPELLQYIESEGIILYERKT